MSASNASIIINTGEPFKPQTQILIDKNELVLGRTYQALQPDIVFTNQHVSRRHAIIEYNSEQYLITDLYSKHGTRVNDISLKPGMPCQLHNNDFIDLALGSVLLIFKQVILETDTTVDLFNYTNSDPFSAVSGMAVNLARREVLVDGKPVPFSGKDLDLLLELYKNRRKAVSYDQIRISVWPERLALINGTVPDVGTDEINALIYRLRKRIEPYGSLVVTIPRFGYRLDL